MGAQEQEPPYPIIAVTDLQENYSAVHFRFAIKQCRDVLAKVIADDNRSDQQVARVKILRYLDLQLARAVRWVDDEADLMAGVTRSLIELRFWADFVSESPENGTRFLNEASIDSRELFERLEKIIPTEMPKLDILLVEGRRVDVKPSGDEESFIWKLSSKLIHPTSLVLNHLDETVHSVQYREFLAVKVLLYAWRIIYAFHNIEWVA
jgi:hypothetical protein